MPNFTAEEKVSPDYRIFLPQSQDSYSIPCLTTYHSSSDDHHTLNNSYIPVLSLTQSQMSPTTLQDDPIHISIPFLYHTDFDFTPVNSSYLLLSRLAFLTKHSRVSLSIHSFISRSFLICTDRICSATTRSVWPRLPTQINIKAGCSKQNTARLWCTVD